MNLRTYVRARNTAHALNRLIKHRVRRRRGEKQSHLERDRQTAQKLLADPNILGFAVGPKISSKSSKQSDFCLVFFVRRKLPKSRLRNMVEIPRHLFLNTTEERVRTDVQEWGGLPVAHSTLQSGASIGGLSGDSGTMTLAVRGATTGDPVILSCSHVIAACGSGQVGDEVESPSQPTSDPGPHVVGRLRLFTKVDPSSFNNLVDAALADPVDGTTLSNAIPQIGSPAGIRDLLLEGENAHQVEVQRFGATTGLQTGVVTNFHLSTRIVYPQLGGASVFFSDLAQYDVASEEGDSGAAVVDSTEEHRVVGMHIAGLLDGFSLFTHIRHVFRLMKVQFPER